MGFSTKHAHVSVGLPRVYVDFNPKPPVDPKVNARAAFVGVCRCTPPKHTSCMQFGYLSELLVAMPADPVVCFCLASSIRTSFPPLRHEVLTDSFY